MKALHSIFIGTILGIAMSCPAHGSKALSILEMANSCAPNIPAHTIRSLISAESAANPYAIGVVGGYLERQPATLQEALVTAQSLANQGYVFSLGLMQVNTKHLQRTGDSYETILEPCHNITIGASILQECYDRAGRAYQNEEEVHAAALSCYYSGNFERGQMPESDGRSYVERVLEHARNAPDEIILAAALTVEGQEPQAIEVKKTQKRNHSKEPWVIFAGQQTQGISAKPQGDAAVSADMDLAPAIARVDNGGNEAFVIFATKE